MEEQFFKDWGKNTKYIFIVISIFLSYYIFGGSYIGLWALLFIPFWSLWLSAPIIFEEKVNFKYTTIGYLFWVSIQYVIFYFGLGVPEGAGIPYF